MVRGRATNPHERTRKPNQFVLWISVRNWEGSVYVLPVRILATGSAHGPQAPGEEAVQWREQVGQATSAAGRRQSVCVCVCGGVILFYQRKTKHHEEEKGWPLLLLCPTGIPKPAHRPNHEPPHPVNWFFWLVVRFAPLSILLSPFRRTQTANNGVREASCFVDQRRVSSDVTVSGQLWKKATRAENKRRNAGTHGKVFPFVPAENTRSSTLKRVRVSEGKHTFVFPTGKKNPTFLLI